MAASPQVSISGTTTYKRILESILIFGSLFSIVLLLQIATTDYSPQLKFVNRPLSYGSYLHTRTRNRPIVGYVTSEYWGVCCGLGNLLWLYASLRGIAADLNRTAYLAANDCFLDYVEELSEVFPNFSDEVVIMEPNESLVHDVEFSYHIPSWENPMRLRSLSNIKFIRLSGSYLQSPHYFNDNDAIRTNVIRLYECGERLIERIGKVRRDLMHSDDGSQHLICIHIRRGDFIGLNWESQPEFIRGAVSTVIEYLANRRYATVNSSQFALLLLGDDAEFNSDIIPTLPFNPQSYIHLLPENITRSEAMCFAERYCDSVLITSHVTTFGWWMGYLMRERDRLAKRGGKPEKEVFYNSERNDRDQKERRTNWPADWVGLDLRVGSNGTEDKVVVRSGHV